MSYSKVGRREAAAARLGLSKRKKKKEKLDIEEVFYILNETHKDWAKGKSWANKKEKVEQKEKEEWKVGHKRGSGSFTISYLGTKQVVNYQNCLHSKYLSSPPSHS